MPKTYIHSWALFLTYYIQLCFICVPQFPLCWRERTYISICITFLNTASSVIHQLHLCEGMLGLNPGVLRLWRCKPESEALNFMHKLGQISSNYLARSHPQLAQVSSTTLARSHQQLGQISSTAPLDLIHNSARSHPQLWLDLIRISARSHPILGYISFTAWLDLIHNSGQISSTTLARSHPITRLDLIHNSGQISSSILPRTHPITWLDLIHIGQISFASRQDLIQLLAQISSTSARSHPITRLDLIHNSGQISSTALARSHPQLGQISSTTLARSHPQLWLDLIHIGQIL